MVQPPTPVDVAVQHALVPQLTAATAFLIPTCPVAERRSVHLIPDVVEEVVAHLFAEQRNIARMLLQRAYLVPMDHPAQTLLRQQ